jgi:hypothetical protein
MARLQPRWLAPLALIALLVAVLAGCAGHRDTALPEPTVPPTGATSTPHAPRTWYVAADAGTHGDGSQRRPFRSIQHGVDVSGPGDTVAVGPGTYRESVVIVHSGTQSAPIRLLGNHAVIRGRGDERLVEVRAHDVVIDGFEITGGNKLVWLVGAQRIRLLHSWLHDAGGECVRIRYRSNDNEIADNRIEGCGHVNFDLERDTKNGEGIYLGTAPEQLDRNPTDAPDTSGGNHIHDNVITSPAECVDMKEHSRDNVVEHNTCSGGQDPNGAGFASRGVGNVIRDNVSRGNAGSGIRVGGDTDSDGIDSTVVDNRADDNGEFGIEVRSEPQQLICGNETHGNAQGDANTTKVDVAAACS